MQHNDEDVKCEIETGFDDRNDCINDDDDVNSKLQQKQFNQHHIEHSNKIILTYSINQHMINDKNFIINNNVFQMKQKQEDLQKVKEIQKQMEELALQLVGEVEDEIEKQREICKQQMEQSQGLDEGDTNTPLKAYSTQPEMIRQFHPQYKSSTIISNQSFTQVQQTKPYYQNCKLSLTYPITSLNSSITFRVDNIKYCVGFGVGLKEILQKHQYDYKSTTSNELGHGLYIITSQGYSWSHSENEEDDVFRGEVWGNLYAGINVNVKLQGQILTFTCKKAQFAFTLPSRIRDKYTLCFCAYLHQKTDAISII